MKPALPRSRPRLKAAALALALGFGAALPAAGADLAALSRMGMLAGSERLGAYAQARAFGADPTNPGRARGLRGALTRLGFYHEGGRPELLSRSLRFSPVLQWDANINGGAINDRLTLGGLVFELDPSRRALSGIVGGVEFGARARLSLAEGRVLDLQAGGEAVWSPQHEIGRAQIGARACLQSHLRGWDFLDFCLAGARGWRDLSQSAALSTTLGLTRLFSAGPGHHALSLSLGAHRQPESQRALSLGWEAIWPHAVTALTLTALTPVEDETVTRYRLAVDADWLLAGRAMGVGLSLAEAGGGRFLGRAREEESAALTFRIAPAPGWSAEVFHQRVRSSVDFFSESRSGLSLRYRFGG